MSKRAKVRGGKIDSPPIGTASWHDRPLQAALDELKSVSGGLSTVEAEARLQRHGPNRLPQPPGRSAALRLLLQFYNILIYVLLGAAVITAGMDHWIDTLVILAVLLAYAVTGFIREGKAEKAMEAIRKMLAPTAAVLRDGQRRSVAGENLVPGDIVLLEAGDKVLADLRIFQACGLQVH